MPVKVWVSVMVAEGGAMVDGDDRVAGSVSNARLGGKSQTMIDSSDDRMYQMNATKRVRRPARDVQRSIQQRGATCAGENMEKVAIAPIIW